MAGEKDMYGVGLREGQVTSSSGKNVKDTMQLKGEAKDSLSGTNKTTQYETSSPGNGKLGAKVQSN